MLTVRSEIGPYRRLITALPRQKQCVRANETQSSLHELQKRQVSVNRATAKLHSEMFSGKGRNALST
jgi:hypothetical protein